jgi:hypothetical protein
VIDTYVHANSFGCLSISGVDVVIVDVNNENIFLIEEVALVTISLVGVEVNDHDPLNSEPGL